MTDLEENDKCHDLIDIILIIFIVPTFNTFIYTTSTYKYLKFNSFYFYR